MRPPPSLRRAALATVLAAGAAPVPQLAAAQQLGGWTYDVAAYGWLTAMTGTVGAGTTRSSVDNGFIDTVEQADSILAFSSHVEARRGLLTFFFDGMWSRLGFENVQAGSSRADVTSTTALVELGAAYQVLDRGYDARGPGGWSLEALAGGRYTDLDTDVSVRGGGGAGSRTQWVDPFIGLRLRAVLSPRWDASLRADIGGWPSGSQFTWNAQALLGYRFGMFGREATAAVGYRALSQDYESAKLVWDVTLHGPVIGLSLRF